MDAPSRSGIAPAGNPTDLRPALVAIGGGVLLFALAWVALRWLFAAGLWGPVPPADDVNLYQSYAILLGRGELPYRDFRVEYPPVSLAAFAVPRWIAGSGAGIDAYRAAFETVMLACGLLMTGYVVMTAWRLGASRRRLALVALLVGSSPLLLGPVIQGRYDLFPAALTVAAIAAAVADRPRLASFIIALAIMAKVYAVVLVPLLVIDLWRRAGRREAVISAVVVGATCAAVLAPFLVAAPEATIRAFTNLANRPLQAETLAAAALFALQSLGLLELRTLTVANSVTVAGSPAAELLAVQTIALVAALGLVYLRFAGGRGGSPNVAGTGEGTGPAAFVLVAAAAVTVFVALGKILSPQYLVWLIPLVPLVAGRRGVAAMAALALALVLTSVFFPGGYFAFVSGDRLLAWVVLARDLTLVGLVVILLGPERWFAAPADAAGRTDAAAGASA